MSTSDASRRHFLKTAALGAAGAPLLAARHAFGHDLGRLGLPAYTAESFPHLRNDYLLAPGVAYLNHASIGTIPKAVHAARQRYLDLCETNPWLYMWGGAWEAPREEVRAKAARLLNAAPETIAFSHNTTETFNVLAHGLPLGPGDEVLFSSLNHAGASLPFDHTAPVRGFTVRRFDWPVRDASTMTTADVLDRYDHHLSPRTKLLVLPHIDNTVGLRHPVRELARLARDRGVAFVAVDAAQTVGMIPVDVQALGIDVLATSPHKWLQAPKGLGLTYVSRRLHEVLRPMWVTWGQNQDAWQGTARIYEDYGTRNLAEVLTLGDALDFQMQLDPDERERRLRALWQHTRALVETHPATTWRSPAAWDLGGSLYTVEVRDRDSRALARRLFEEHGFVFRPFQIDGLQTVRLSPNVFTAEDDLTRFFELATQE